MRTYAKSDVFRLLDVKPGSSWQLVPPINYADYCAKLGLPDAFTVVKVYEAMCKVSSVRHTYFLDKLKILSLYRATDRSTV